MIISGRFVFVEPTTGLDPDNRQMVWHIIQRIKQPNRLILLTTHSMEEAEALCTRIGIMAKGQLRCIGSSQHLKSKYGKGFTLTLNLLPCASPEGTREQQERVDGFIVKTLSNGQGKLLSAINRTRKFLIPKKMVTAENILINTDISEIFRLMEANKAVLKIREWGLSLTTLEEVFISAVE